MATQTKSNPDRPVRSRRSTAAKSATSAATKSTSRTASARVSRPDEPEPSAPTGNGAAVHDLAMNNEHIAAEHHARSPHQAAETARRSSRTRVTIPGLGHIDLPPTDELVYIAGVGALAILGAVEWPVAVVLGAGHALANRRRNKLLREFGEALERV